MNIGIQYRLGVQYSKDCSRRIVRYRNFLHPKGWKNQCIRKTYSCLKATAYKIILFLTHIVFTNLFDEFFIVCSLTSLKKKRKKKICVFKEVKKSSNQNGILLTPAMKKLYFFTSDKCRPWQLHRVLSMYKQLHT